MINITLDKLETVVLTLSEKVLGDDPVFLFMFKHQLTNATIFFTPEDISSHITRYNEFEIQLNTADDIEEGNWDYIIYELTNTSPEPISGIVSTYDVTGLTILETGKVLILPATEPTEVIYDEPITEKVYNS